MVSEQQSIGHQRLQDFDRAPKLAGIVEIGTGIADLGIHLRQRRGTEPIAPGAQVDQQQATVVFRVFQIRCHPATYVSHRCKRRDDE